MCVNSSFITIIDACEPGVSTNITKLALCLVPTGRASASMVGCAGVLAALAATSLPVGVTAFMKAPGVRARGAMSMAVARKDSYSVTLLPGDGIGPEITAATVS